MRSSALGEGHPLEFYHVSPVQGYARALFQVQEGEIELSLSVPLPTQGFLTFQVALPVRQLSMTGLTPCWPYRALGSSGSQSRDFAAAVVGNGSILCSSGII